MKKKKTKNILKPTLVKIACILLATMVFFYVRLEQEQTEEYIVDIDIMNIPSKLAILSEGDTQTKVTIRLFKDNYVKLPDKLTAYIDLTNAKVGSNLYNIILNDNEIREADS